MQQQSDNLLRVLYDFRYTAKDGREISVRQGEDLYLINKTNTDWWQVIRSTKERPFFVPAQYVVEQKCEYQNKPVIAKDNENVVKPVPKMRTKLRGSSKESLTDNGSDKELYNQGDRTNRMKNSYNLKAPENRLLDIKLSPSLEKLAEEIKFAPKSTEGKFAQKGGNTTLKHGKSADADVALSEKPPVKPRSSLWSSFKRKQHGLKKFKETCVLSSSWEGGLDKIPEKSQKVQITSGGLQRSRTFMFPEKVKESSRRLDAYNDRTIKTTLTTFKPLQKRQLMPYENVPHVEMGTNDNPQRKKSSAFHSGGTLELVPDTPSDCDPDLEEKSLPRKGNSKILLETQLSVESIQSNHSDDLENSGKLMERNTKKRTSIQRRQRVEPTKRLRYPPTPPAGLMPQRDLGEGWGEYKTEDGRAYYFNTKSEEKNWKPPRKWASQIEHGSSKDSLASEQSSSSPLASRDSQTPSPLGAVTGDNLPSEEEALEVSDHGYLGSVQRVPSRGSNGPAGECVSSFAADKWRSQQQNDRVVPDSNTRWKLPGLAHSDFPYGIQRSATESAINQRDDPTISTINHRHDIDRQRASISNRFAKTQSMIIEHKSQEDLSSFRLQCIKCGYLNRTKIVDNGQSIKKNWLNSFIVLFPDHLLQLRDEKNYALFLKDSQSVRHMRLPLRGAIIEEGGKISSQKNVYKISSTDRKSVILLQSNNKTDITEWIQLISSVIESLSSPKEHSVTSSSSSLEPSPTNKIARSKSVKAKSKLTGSTDDLNGNADEHRKKIRDRLKKFFLRRPHIEILRQQQIYKDEPVFGSSLEQLTKNMKDEKIPEFVEKCIQVIERKEENMKTDGLYRASGNLSQVQKIRLQVDQGKLDGLEQEEDVHVLTGCLKLFFRELKEPLIPFRCFNQALKATTNKSDEKKIKEFREIIKGLPPPNKDTLTFLLRHLHTVQSYSDANRMHIQNLAIVFGPTLMWTEEESHELAIELMQQNQVVECLLNHFDRIFSN